MLLYSSYDNTLFSCSTRHMQVYFVLQKAFTDWYTGVRYSLPFVIYSC